MIGVSLARLLDEAHAGQLPAMIYELGDTSVARALRIDLALLVARPELAWPALYRRCTWLDWGADYREPWWRPLREPLVEPEGLLEEYRTSRAGRLWLTETHVGVDEHAWERVTGRRIDMRPPPVDELRLENDSDMLDEPRYCLVDRGQVRWSQEGRAAACARFGDAVLVASQSALLELGLADGHVRRRWPGYVGRDLAAAGDVFATRHHDVIRIWRDPPGGFPSLTGAMLAANNDRAVLGDQLVDLRDGNTLGHLLFRARTSAKRMGYRCVVEAHSLGAAAWIADDGAPFGESQRIAVDADDTVVIDAMGEFLAIWHRRAGELTINRTCGAMNELVRRRVGEVVALAFSPDQREVWWRDDHNRTWAVRVRDPHDVRRHELEVPMRDEPTRLPIVDGTFEHEGRIGITDCGVAIASGRHVISYDGVWVR